MDLSKLNITDSANSGATVTLRDPVTLEDLDTTITVVGRDSDIFRNHVKKIVDKNRSKKRLSMDEAERQNIELLAVCTIAWTNVQEGDTVYECSFENAKYIYKKYPWIREQLDEFQEERANFLSR